MNGFGMTYCFGSLGGRKKRRFAFKNTGFEFPWANRRFFLPHNSPQKWCHPEFILPDNYTKSPDNERMNEGSPSLVSNLLDHYWLFEYK